VGNIYRSAYAFGYRGVIHVGITPEKNNPNFLSSSRGCENFLDTVRFDHISEALKFSREMKLKIYSLEIGEKADKLNAFNFEDNFVIVIGNEALGVSEFALKNSDKIISIETPGFKDSLNVGVAFGIFSYAMYLKQIKY